jgi:hypothetical protein
MEYIRKLQKEGMSVKILDKLFYEGVAEACEIAHWFLILKHSLPQAFFIMKIVYSISLADSMLSEDEIAKETAEALLPYLNFSRKQTQKGTLFIVNGRELHSRDYAEEVDKIIRKYRDHIAEKHGVHPTYTENMLG